MTRLLHNPSDMLDKYAKEECDDINKLAPIISKMKFYRERDVRNMDHIMSRSTKKEMLSELIGEFPVVTDRVVYMHYCSTEEGFGRRIKRLKK